jgi:hypothetical protein
MVFLQIGAADPATQVDRQVADDVVDGLGHRREGVVGSEDDVIVAKELHRCVQHPTAVRQ